MTGVKMLFKESCARSEVDGINLRGRKQYPDAFLNRPAGGTWGLAFRELKKKDIESQQDLD